MNLADMFTSSSLEIRLMFTRWQKHFVRLAECGPDGLVEVARDDIESLGGLFQAEPRSHQLAGLDHVSLGDPVVIASHDHHLP